jgi:hypothetical protein
MWVIDAEGELLNLNNADTSTCIVEFYTGLEDKTDTQIFEGDVICVDGANYEVVRGNRMCNWYCETLDGNNWIFPMSDDYFNWNRAKIIGTIHDKAWRKDT